MKHIRLYCPEDYLFPCKVSSYLLLTFSLLTVLAGVPKVKTVLVWIRENYRNEHRNDDSLSLIILGVCSFGCTVLFSLNIVLLFVGAQVESLPRELLYMYCHWYVWMSVHSISAVETTCDFIKCTLPIEKVIIQLFTKWIKIRIYHYQLSVCSHTWTNRRKAVLAITITLDIIQSHILLTLYR